MEINVPSEADQPETSESNENRLGQCEVCNDSWAKYKCPECEVKTCSLKCCNVHKTELECSGIRNRVKYVSLKSFSDLDLLSDYRLLEEINRGVETSKKCRNSYRENKFKYERVLKLKNAALKKGIKLQTGPPGLVQHKNNTSMLKLKEDEIYWRIDWRFPCADEYCCTDYRVKGSTLLIAALQKHLSVEDVELQKRLSPYPVAQLSDVRVLFKAEGVQGEKYFILNFDQSINESLKYKKVMEYPTFVVILASDLPNYHIVHIVVSKKEKRKTKNLLEFDDHDLESDDEKTNAAED